MTCPSFYVIILILSDVSIHTKASSDHSGESHKLNGTRPNYPFNVTDEQRLLQTILRSYDSSTRPIFDASESVEVRFQFTLIQVSQLDEVNQVLTTNVWIEQEWIDERLVWPPSEYNNLSIVRIPCNKIWLPDIVLYNSADDFTTGYMQSKAMVDFKGLVFWPPPAKLRSTCKIDITYFPFDDQKCKMKFGSWTYDGFQVNVTTRRAQVDTTEYVKSGEWDLLNVEVIRNEVVYPCCPEPYPDITFYIIIRRRTLYYLFNIIFPCLWLTILSLLGFWLPPDSGEKITLGITVLLAFSVFMLLIAENMPATSEFVPLIGIYLTVTMATTSLSIVLTVLVLHVHHVGSNHDNVSPNVKYFFFDIIAPMLCMDSVKRYRIRKREIHTTYFNNIRIDQEHPPPPTSNRGCGHKKKRLTCLECMNSKPLLNHNVSTIEVSPADVPLVPKYNSNHDFCNNEVTGRVCSVGYTPTFSSSIRRLENFHFRRRNSDELPNSLRTSYSNTTFANPVTSQRIQTRPTTPSELASQYFDEIRRHLNNLIQKEMKEEALQETINDWKMVAYIVDRLLFWIFLLTAIISTLGILIIMPYFKKELTDSRIEPDK